MSDRERRDETRRTPTADALREKLPPHSREAEMALLGSMLLDPKVIGDVIAVIEDGAPFYVGGHGDVFEAIRDIYDVRQAADAVQISEELSARGILEQIGGEDYIVDLIDGVPSAVNAPHYAKIVRDKKRLRDLIDSAAKMIDDAYNAGSSDPQAIQEILERAEQSVFKVARQESKDDPERLSDLLHEELQRLEEIEGVGVSGIKTGFHDLDEKLSGLHDGEMVIVAARPSMGKTALALNLAEQVSRGGRLPHTKVERSATLPVAFFSLEMSKSSVVQRLICGYAPFDSHRLRTGRFGSEDFTSKLIPACNDLSEAPLYIDDTPALTLLGLRARARRLKAQHGIRCIFIDYLQLLSSPGQARESRQVEVSTISRGIKALARELNLPVICLAQLNRGTEQREGNRPRMSDLRESGSIEQDADVVALLHREAYYHVNDPEWAANNPGKENVAELIVAKQRNGPTGVVRMVWDSGTTRFKNYTGDWDDEESFSPPQVYTREIGSGSAPPAAGQAGSAFASRARTGPAENHRDGGGSDARDSFGDDTGGAPF
ncbi:MAG: replicative DNA helicase [Planctomycetota bacterium]